MSECKAVLVDEVDPRTGRVVTIARYEPHVKQEKFEESVRTENEDLTSQQKKYTMKHLAANEL